MAPTFPHTKVQSLASWSNYSGTIGGRSIPVYCSPEGGTTPEVLRAHGTAVREILRYCFTRTPVAPLRTLGSTWSFSRVVEPGQVAIDPGNLTYMMRVPPEHFTEAYRAHAAKGFAPVFAEGGTGISSINRRLGRDLGLALRTSGAGDGHRIGGCIATGTHGSALRIGALHDTVLALYLVVGPDQALFVQRGTLPPFEASAADWIAQRTGIPTRHVADDAAFRAAQVSLGSLGFVFGVVLDTTPLYRFRILRTRHPAGSPAVMHAIRTLDTSALHPDVPRAPYHFSVVIHPYPLSGEPGMFVTLMWRVSAKGVPFASPSPNFPRTSSDTMGLIAGLADAFGDAPFTGPATRAVVQHVIQDQLLGGSKPAKRALFPGQVFGPTSLPPGQGASTELAVDHAQLDAALATVFEVIEAEGARGNLLLGCVAVRFVPKTRALLGMNQFDMTAFIELPSIRNDDVLQVYAAIWAALDAKGIRFACHWGQLGGFTPARVQRYYGAHVAQWKAARRALLSSDSAMQVFEAPILREAGLDG